MGKRTDNLLIGVCIADLHFGAFDPQKQYNILKEQFINVIKDLPVLDYIAILGDLYDHKMMGNSNGLLYASLLVEDIVQIAKEKNAIVVILNGTFSHDANQTSNLYHYLNDPSIDIRIITSVQFIDIRGTKILCIPELYGLDESIYQDYLTYSGYYDLAFLHGTFEGSVYGNNVGQGRLFTIHDFMMCKGFMVGGHVHTPGCHKGYFYYTGTPYRYKFGEEEAKGFLITIYDYSTRGHYVHFKEITSDTYITINIEDIISNDPKVIIDYINKLQKDQGINYLKVRFKYPIDGSDKVIIDNYYRNNPNTFVEFLSLVEEQKIKDREAGLIEDNQYDFILDPKIPDLEKFVRYVNMKEECTFITVDKLKEILSEV